MRHNEKRFFVTTVASTGLAMAINYLISLVLTSYLTATMGSEAYGFVSLTKTISNYAIVLTSCMNAYASRFITVSYHAGDMAAVNKYYSTILISNLVLSAGILLVASGFVWKLERFMEIPQELMGQVKLLLFLNFVNYLIFTTGTMFAAAAYIRKQLALAGLFKLTAYLVEAIALVLMFRFLTPKLYYVGIALILSSVTLFALNYSLTRRVLPELSISRKHCKKSAVRELFVSGIWNSINNLGNLLNSGIDLWVSNLLLSAAAMGQLSIVKTLSTIFTSLFQLVSHPFHPALLEHYAKKDKEGLARSFDSSIKVNGYFSNLLFVFLTVFGMVYYRLWVPRQDHALLQSLTVLTLIGAAFEGPIYPLFYTYTLTLKNRIPCIVTVASGLLNLLSMVIILKTTSLGLYGVVITTTVLAFLVYIVFTPLYSSHCLGTKCGAFYRPLLLTYISMGISLGLMLLISKLWMPTSWLGLIAAALLTAVVTLVPHVALCLKPSDYQRLLGKLRGK